MFEYKCKQGLGPNSVSLYQQIPSGTFGGRVASSGSTGRCSITMTAGIATHALCRFVVVVVLGSALDVIGVVGKSG